MAEKHGAMNMSSEHPRASAPLTSGWRGRPCDAQSQENAISLSPRMSRQLRKASIPSIPFPAQGTETFPMDGFNATIRPPRFSWTSRTMRRPSSSPPTPSDGGPGSLPLSIARAIADSSEKIVLVAPVSTSTRSVTPAVVTGAKYCRFTSFESGFRHDGVRSIGTVGAFVRRRSDRARANGTNLREGVLRSSTAAIPAGAKSCGDTRPPRCSDLKMGGNAMTIASYKVNG